MACIGRELHEGLVDVEEVAAMGLIGNDEMACRDAQSVAEPILMGKHHGGLVASVGRTIEGAVCTTATASVTCGTECRSSCMEHRVSVV